MSLKDASNSATPDRFFVLVYVVLFSYIGCSWIDVMKTKLEIEQGPWAFWGVRKVDLEFLIVP